MPRVSLHPERRVGDEDVRLFAERRGEPPQALLPWLDVDGDGSGGCAVNLRILAREIRHRLLGLHLRGDVRLDLRQALGGLLEPPIGHPPQHGAKGLLVLASFARQRKHGAAEGPERPEPIAANLVRVVELVVADAHVDDGAPVAAVVARNQRAERRAHARRADVVHGVAGEIRRNRLLLQAVEVALQLGAQQGQERIADGASLSLCLSDGTGPGHEQQGQGQEGEPDLGSPPARA